LKQGQFSPLKVEEQVAVIYAGVNGYLDSLETSSIGRFETGLLEILRTKEIAILDAIRTEKAVSENTEEALKKVIEAFKASFA
jgi:F-type H+/Na+-transporting ATPase subunit alpha